MIVIDTSFALQWLLNDEPDAHLAERLVTIDELASADILAVEAANVLAKKVRRGEIEIRQAQEGLRFIRARVPLQIPSAELVERALELSVQLAHPVYDCVFLACAERLHAVLATRDQPFIDRVRQGGLGELLMAGTP